jgi:OmpA family
LQHLIDEELMKLYLKLSILILSVLTTCVLFGQDRSKCIETDLGDILFNRKSSRLTFKAKRKLDSLVVIIKSNETCQVVATGYAADLCDKCASLSWDRSQSVLSYLAKRGVPTDRMAWTVLLEGNLNFVRVAFVSRIKLEETPPRLKLRRS